MPIHDFLDKAAPVNIGGRFFIMRPLTVRGLVQAQGIFSAAIDSVSQEDHPEEWGAMALAFERVSLAAASDHPGEILAAMSDLYGTLLDNLGRRKFAELFALVLDPADPDILVGALADSPEAGVAELLKTFSGLHDIPRLLGKYGPAARSLSTSGVEPVTASGAQAGLETALLGLARFLHGAYTLEALLDWPAERFMSALEQKRVLEELEQPQTATALSPLAPGAKQAGATALRGLGLSVSSAPRKAPGPKAN